MRRQKVWHVEDIAAEELSPPQTACVPVVPTRGVSGTMADITVEVAAS